MIKPLVIRADAGGILGTGHVMRMIALAQAYIKRGGRVVIASVQCPEPVIERVEELAIEHHLFEGCELGDTEDAYCTLELCEELGAQWLVLDGYHFDETYQKRVSEHGIKVLAVDDYGHCSTWHCDAVLNQNLGAENWTSRTASRPDTQWLLGSSFALIREEFLESIQGAKEKSFPSRRILVTMGGADPDNVTLMVLKALETTILEGLKIRVLVGGANPHQGVLSEFKKSSGHHIEILCNVRDMPAMYEWTDAVVSAGGSTCWEWLAYGLPGAVVTIAKNQEPVVKELDSQKLALSLGWFTQFDLNVWSENLKEWLEGDRASVGFDERRQVIDGWGTARVASFLDGGVWCRPATSSDSRLYFDWANDSAVRASAFHSELIKLSAHEKWFKAKLRSESSQLLVCSKVGGTPIGQVRFDFDASISGWYIDYSVDVSHRGLGLGLETLEAAILQFASMMKDRLVLFAEVKIENIASMRVFENLGFTKKYSDAKCLLYTLNS